jgi:hypothetical protein
MLAALSAEKLELGVDLVRRLFFFSLSLSLPFPAALATRFNDAAGFFGKPVIVSAGAQPALDTTNGLGSHSRPI